MKAIIISVLMLFTCMAVSAQERDLDYYIGQATINSPLINKARNDNKIVTLDLQQINRILTNPEINFVSGVTLAPIISHDNNTNRFQLVSEGATDYTGHDLALTDGGQYQALVSINQPLLSGSKYKAYENKADLSQRINSNKINLTIHELEQIIGYQYILCLKAWQQAIHSLTLLNELNSQVTVMRKLAGNAVYKQTDLMILQIEAQNYEAEYRTNMADYRSSLYDLNLVCGIADTSMVDLADINFVLKPESARKSDFLISYQLDSLNILADQTVNELKYKPQVDLFADVGLNAAYLPYHKRTGLSTGFTLNWNIFDGHQRNIQREKSAIELQTLEYEKNNFMTMNDLHKRKILGQLNAIDQRITVGVKQVVEYEKLYDSYSKELALGEVSVMDFKNVVKDMAVKKQELIQLRLEKQLLINSFNYLNY
ncbi:MAG: TolC family protein [Bacteroidales bacterium]|nr:TolC family protein [Bacteroidales bacterium]